MGHQRVNNFGNAEYPLSYATCRLFSKFFGVRLVLEALVTFSAKRERWGRFAEIRPHLLTYHPASYRNSDNAAACDAPPRLGRNLLVGARSVRRVKPENSDYFVLLLACETRLVYHKTCLIVLLVKTIAWEIYVRHDVPFVHG